MDRAVLRNPALLEAARAGLARRPRAMSPKWFYDAEGSALFEKITDLPEYYPTRTETGILASGLDRIAALGPEGAELVELGSGASTKTRLLLDRLDGLSAYVPVDVSEEFLQATAARLGADYPGLAIRPVAGDFTGPLPLSDTGVPRVGFFPGSTIGNLDPEAAVALLAAARRWPGAAGFVLGADLVKDPAVLKRAYDDAAGVTAAFNLNLLARMNREIGADFDLSRFAHLARWNAAGQRIEMHLQSLAPQTVRFGGDAYRFEEGETIHTENSRKFTPEGLAEMAEASGWRIAELLTDPDRLFAVALLAPRA